MWNQEQMLDQIVKLIESAKTEVFAFLNAYTLTITTDNDLLQIPKRAARGRGVKFHYITEITQNNISYCRKQLDLVDELRHMNRIRGNFILSDDEFIASHEISPRHPITNGYYSKVDQLLKQERYVFQTLSDSAIPAAERIRQLEGHIGSQTNVSIDKAAAAIQQNNIDRFYVCEDCRNVFIYSHDVEEHTKSTSHSRYNKYPFFE